MHFYTSNIHNAHVVYTVLGHIQPVIHTLYTFIHQTYTLYMSHTQYWAIFNRPYIVYTLLYIRHSPCRIHGIGPYSTDDTWLVHFHTSVIHPIHVVYAVLGHIPMVIHGLYTFIHQTYTLHMSYTRYWAIFNRWYIACTLLYIRHSACTCRIRGIHQTFTLYGNIQPLIHSLYTFIHQTFTLYMSYTRYWEIFNRWYMACTLLYIRYTSCTCRIRGIRQYSHVDTWLVHFYTSDIHPVQVVYAVLGHIQPLIHSLYTFTHQTFTLYMSYTWYWAIFKKWYIPCALLYIRHTPCTCSIHGIGPYSTIDA